MPFENGFPIEESIKIELYNFEPEQLSDLVYVPIQAKLTIFLSRFFYIDKQSNPINIVIRFINFPFNFSVLTSNEARPTRNIPMLFQRFNPYNKPFADGYSQKLFDFFNQFSNYTLYRSLGHFARRVNDNNLPDVLELNQLYLDNYVFNELTINTPNNGLKIEFSYYYAEINPDEVPNSYIYLNQQVIYSRISNQCMQTEPSRAWLIEFNELLSIGDTFIIKDNILVGSLIINFIDNPSLELYWTEPDKDYILSQIPDYYFYDNLDDFFKMITNEILNQDPNILKEVEVPTELNYNFSIGRLQSFISNLTLANYQQITLDLYPRLLLYANNNNWNNTYEWVNNNNNGTTYTDIKNLIYLDYQLNTVNFQTEDDSIITINRVDTFLNNLDRGFNNDYNRYNASDRFRHRTNDTVAIYKRNGITYDGLF
ncbi:MAG: hypothetical protein QNJ65_01005 [Xenococcaceae cyanobacterium MO_234.B1]|nr:hypothetical protein [Xenococcaceae cyanobacterium MO_234.B1]